MITYHIGLFLLCGALVNDILIISDNPATSVAKVMFIIGAFLTLLEGLPRRKLSKTDVVVFTYAALLILIGLFAPKGGAADGWRTITLSLVIGIVGHFVFASVASRNLHRLARHFLFWVVLSIAIGVIQSLTGKLFVSDRQFDSLLLLGLHRASGLAADPNYFGLICLMGIPLVEISKIKSKNLTQLIKITLMLGVILSGSRSSLMVLIIYSFIKSLLFGRKKVKALIISVLMISCVFVLLMQFGPDSIKMIFDPSAYSDNAERNSLQDRSVAAFTAIEVGLENPVFGYGLGSFREHPLNIHNQASHNTYLELFAESGILGLILFLLVVTYLIRRLSRDKLNYGLFRNAALLFFVFSLMSLFLVTHYSRLFFFVTGLVSGIIDLAKAYKDSTRYGNSSLPKYNANPLSS